MILSTTYSSTVNPIIHKIFDNFLDLANKGVLDQINSSKIFRIMQQLSSYKSIKKRDEGQFLDYIIKSLNSSSRDVYHLLNPFISTIRNNFFSKEQLEYLWDNIKNSIPRTHPRLVFMLAHNNIFTDDYEVHLTTEGNYLMNLTHCINLIKHHHSYKNNEYQM